MNCCMKFLIWIESYRHWILCLWSWSLVLVVLVPVARQVFVIMDAVAPEKIAARRRRGLLRRLFRCVESFLGLLLVFWPLSSRYAAVRLAGRRFAFLLGDAIVLTLLALSCVPKQGDTVAPPASSGGGGGFLIGEGEGQDSCQRSRSVKMKRRRNDTPGLRRSASDVSGVEATLDADAEEFRRKMKHRS